MKIDIVSLGWEPAKMGKQGAVVMVAIIRRPLPGLKKEESEDKRVAMNAIYKEIAHLRLGYAELTQKDTEEESKEV